MAKKQAKAQASKDGASTTATPAKETTPASASSRTASSPPAAPSSGSLTTPAPAGARQRTPIPDPIFDTSLELTGMLLFRSTLLLVFLAVPVAATLNDLRSIQERPPLGYPESAAVYAGVLFGGELFWRFFIWLWARAVKSVREGGEMGHLGERAEPDRAR